MWRRLQLDGVLGLHIWIQKIFCGQRLFKSFHGRRPPGIFKKSPVILIMLMAINVYCFLMITYDQMSLHIKFHENPNNCFWVIESLSSFWFSKIAWLQWKWVHWITRVKGNSNTKPPLAFLYHWYWTMTCKILNYEPILTN